MINLKYFYVKLSCPKTEDDDKFLTLFQESAKHEKFNFDLENIPNNLENSNPNDIIFIHSGGDKANKRKYFRDYPDFRDYENGLQSIGIINSVNVEAKEVLVTIIGLKEIVTKEDLYFFPQFINNLGGSTKGTPNQAGLFELDEKIALSLIDYLYKRKFLSKDHDIFKNLIVNDVLYSKALSDYDKRFKEKNLTKKVFEKFSGNIGSELQQNNPIIKAFVEWFSLTENFKKSYEGIVNKENLSFWDSSYFNHQLFKITGNDKTSAFERIKGLINNNENSDWLRFNLSSSKGAPKAVLGSNNYLLFLDQYLNDYEFIQNNKTEPFDILKFHEDCTNSNLKYKEELVTRYTSSLATKPFVLLSGLSGSGKTKLAQGFAQWICEEKTQYCIVPVGADWTNRDPLLGYVNALDNNEYILPENGALKLLIEANKPENQKKPFFLILDEMNLSHVERYFADFLSVMESNDSFKLHSSDNNLNITVGEKYSKSIEVPSTVNWPSNLFVVGTVNIDETTYMFSPKVLDRANVIEFRINVNEMKSFLSEAKDVAKLDGEGASMGGSFISIANNKSKENSESLETALNSFFKTLQKVGAEFGYRTASEIQILFGKIDEINPAFSNKEHNKIDIAIMQKLLPKLHGSRSKLSPVLKTLAALCYKDNEKFTQKQHQEIFETIKDDTKSIQYPLSLEKITKMYENVISNGFTSYAEA